MCEYVADLFIKKMIKKSIIIEKANILVMGFSFKENCPDIRNTGVINFVNRIKEYDCKVDIYDPLVSSEEVFNLYKIKVYKNIPNKK